MNIFSTFPTLSTGLEAFGLTLFHSLWQGILIGLVCGLLLKMMHKKMATLKFIVAYIALILLFLSFTGTFYVQYQALSPAAQEISLITAVPDKEIPATINTASSREDWWTEVTFFYRECIQKLIAYAPFIVVGWFLGFLWYTTQLTMGVYQTRQMKRKSYVPERKWINMLQHLVDKMKIQRRIQLLISSQAGAPFTLGWFKPVILLPPGIFTELSPEQLEAILVHELAHIKRHDYLLNIIQRVLEVFLFFNPAYWYIAGILEKEREQACDQITIKTLHHPMVYARALTHLAEISQNIPSNLAVAAIGKQNLQQRIRNIMQNSSYTSHCIRPAAFKWYQLAAIIVLGVVFTMLTPDVQGIQAKSSVEQQIPATDSVFTVSGQVNDHETGKPLPGINIIVKGNKIGTVTKLEGNYQIKVSGPEDTLTFFFIGYEKKEVAIESRKVINVNMKREDQKILEEVFIPELLPTKGYVIDSENGQPLSGVKVENKGTNEGTVTDSNGNYSITMKFLHLHDNLVFSYPGYKQIAVQVKGNNGKKVNVQLEKEESLQTSQNDSPIDVTKGNNASTRDSSKKILYILDGVVQDSEKKVLSEIDPLDIKSVEVFKNNSESFSNIAQAYLKGEIQAYDGIIIIKTKRKNSPDISNMEDKAFDNKLIVFPNPSDDQLSVQFQLEETAHVRVEVVDMNGQSVALLANQIFEPGVHQVEWSEAVQKSGWYVIKVSRGDQVFTRKVALE